MFSGFRKTNWTKVHKPEIQGAHRTSICDPLVFCADSSDLFEFLALILYFNRVAWSGTPAPGETILPRCYSVLLFQVPENHSAGGVQGPGVRVYYADPGHLFQWFPRVRKQEEARMSGSASQKLVWPGKEFLRRAKASDSREVPGNGNKDLDFRISLHPISRVSAESTVTPDPAFRSVNETAIPAGSWVHCWPIQTRAVLLSVWQKYRKVSFLSWAWLGESTRNQGPVSVFCSGSTRPHCILGPGSWQTHRHHFLGRHKPQWLIQFPRPADT